MIEEKERSNRNLIIFWCLILLFAISVSAPVVMILVNDIKEKPVCGGSYGGGTGDFFYDSYCPTCANDQSPNLEEIDTFYCNKTSQGFYCDDYWVTDETPVESRLVCCNKNWLLLRAKYLLSDKEGVERVDRNRECEKIIG